MVVAYASLVAHSLAVLFALAGMLVALPNPELWAHSELGTRIFALGMQHGGSLHIVLGALAMASFGIVHLGAKRTAIFLAASVTLSLGAELLGVGTGLPFGEYAYTSGLGYKILGLVPYSVPLSWFYMGMAAYLLAGSMLSVGAKPAQGWMTVALGAYLLTVWDVVLDPAMSNAVVPVKFWVWYEQGMYLGMPVKNFAGWALTALAFMSVSRVLWRSEPSYERMPVSFPFAMFSVNMVFAIVLSAAGGLWLPIVLSVALALAPAGLIWLWRGRLRPSPRPHRSANAVK